jgi:hypothetical protein
MNTLRKNTRLIPLAVLMLATGPSTVLARESIEAGSRIATHAAASAAPVEATQSNAQASSLLVRRYEGFIGSAADTRSIIQGLRYGELVTLEGSGAAGGTVSFLPPTKPMGWGSVDRALSLAQADLLAQGITQPGLTQLKLALNGGTLINASGDVVSFKGVLNLRSQGMGWGEVAQRLNVSPAARIAAGPSSVGLRAEAGVSGTRADVGARSDIAANPRMTDAMPMRSAATSTAGIASATSLPTASGHGVTTATSAMSVGSVMGSDRGMSALGMRGGASAAAIGGGLGLGVGRR